MAIAALSDGFVSICIDDSLNVLGEKCRVLLEGQYIPNPDLVPAIDPDKPLKINNTREIDEMFGAGSILAESLKVAIDCCGGDLVEFYALPRLDAAGSTAAEFTLTVTGPATGNGTINIFWGDSRYNTSVRVFVDDTAEEIAAAIADAVDTDFFYTATAAAGVVTLVAKNAGTVGNQLVPVINWQGLRGVFPEGVDIVVAQSVVGAGDPTPIEDYRAILGDCCYCCIGMLYEDVRWQDGMIDYIADAWDCTKPQCFGHGYTYNSGTLGEILGTDSNSKEVSRMAHCHPAPLEGDPVFPWLKVAAFTAKSCCETVGNPERSVQGPNFGVLQCLQQPATCFPCFTFEELEELRDSGFVTTTGANGGDGVLTRPMVNNDVTNYRFDENGRENLTYRDASQLRLITETAKSLAEKLQEYNGLGLFNRNTTIRPGTQGTSPRLILGGLRAWAKSQVGILFGEFDDLDKQLTVNTDDEIKPKCYGVPGVLHVNLIYQPPVRIEKFIVNAAPKLRTNCG